MIFRVEASMYKLIILRNLSKTMFKLLFQQYSWSMSGYVILYRNRITSTNAFYLWGILNQCSVLLIQNMSAHFDAYYSN